MGPSADRAERPGDARALFPASRAEETVLFGEDAFAALPAEHRQQDVFNCKRPRREHRLLPLCLPEFYSKRGRGANPGKNSCGHTVEFAIVTQAT